MRRVLVCELVKASKFTCVCVLCAIIMLCIDQMKTNEDGETVVVFVVQV